MVEPAPMLAVLHLRIAIHEIAGRLGDASGDAFGLELRHQLVAVAPGYRRGDRRLEGILVGEPSRGSRPGRIAKAGAQFVHERLPFAIIANRDRDPTIIAL